MNFNPTRVRLKRGEDIDPKPVIDPLQPHEGTSETRRPLSGARIVGNFNPTRVRLKPVAVVDGELLDETSTPRGYV